MILDQEKPGQTQVVTQTMHGERGKGWLLSVSLGISLIIHLVCIFVIRDYGTEQRLKQYNIDWFKAHEFSDLKAEVATDHDLIRAFGPQQCRR